MACEWNLLKTINLRMPIGFVGEKKKKTGGAGTCFCSSCQLLQKLFARSSLLSPNTHIFLLLFLNEGIVGWQFEWWVVIIFKICFHMQWFLEWPYPCIRIVCMWNLVKISAADNSTISILPCLHTLSVSGLFVSGKHFYQYLMRKVFAETGVSGYYALKV